MNNKNKCNECGKTIDKKRKFCSKDCYHANRKPKSPKPKEDTNYAQQLYDDIQDDIQNLMELREVNLYQKEKALKLYIKLIDENANIDLNNHIQVNMMFKRLRDWFIK